MQKTILIAAGGTGGHIFPGLAVAEKLIANGHNVSWIGTVNGLESILVPKHNINIYYIKISGFRGKFLVAKLLAVFNIAVAIVQAIKIIKLLNPSVILGMGGFVSGPVGLAAWLLGKKLIIHEQNKIVGSSNRILAYFADHLLESFPNSFAEKFAKKIILTGLPVRSKLLNIDLPDVRQAQQAFIKSKNNNSENNILKILILGGSRGAQFLNQNIPKIFGGLKNISVLHQSGEKELIATIDLYAKYATQDTYEVRPFIANMLEAYLNADLVICRAGASTVFEIMAIGVAAIFIPLPWAIDDHQTKNALYLVNHNAGIMLQQPKCIENQFEDQLKNLILELMQDRNKLYALQSAARSLYTQYELNNSADYISAIISG